MQHFMLFLLCTCGLVFSIDKPLSSKENQNTQQTQTVIENEPSKDSNNIWDRVKPSDKAYEGEYAPAWGWVLTDWGD